VLFHDWYRSIISMRLRRCYKLGFLSTLSLLIVLVAQQGALAFSTQQMLASPQNLSLGYFGLGLFAGSLLVIESRRLHVFFFGWLLLIVLSVVAGWVSSYALRESYTTLLWVPALWGVCIGTFLVGGWWWIYRQGYGYAIATFLFRRDSHNPILDQLIEHHAPEYIDSDLSMGVFQHIQYRAAAIRYRRLLSQSGFHTLRILLHDQIRQDEKAERDAQQTIEKKQAQAKIEALINRADHLCKP